MLTKPMKEALELLAIEDRQTTRNSHHGYIGGQTMKGLVRRGLAKDLSESCAGERFYRITTLGLSESMNLKVEKIAEKVEQDIFAPLVAQ